MKSEITEGNRAHVLMDNPSTERLGRRRYPIGAELIEEDRVSFRVWAPKARRVEVASDEAEGIFHPLEEEPGGYFSGEIEARAHQRYRFRIDGAENFHPDPASRYQPEGPHGPSCIIDSTQFAWSDSHWRGRELKGQIIYEMHIGTFTPEGTWRAAAQQLDELARIGVTVIEMMPVAEFPGRFGWGYDGVDLFAPCHLYGEPDDLKAFIDRAHALGIAVIHDVVYNHFGPDGNYLRVFSDDYFTDKYENEWGDSINFDGANSDPVREFFLTNALYWIEEFHFDGFRFDATQDIKDESPVYILAEISDAIRSAAKGRSLILIAENEPQHTKLVRSRDEGGDGLDGLWNDDLHHSAIVAVTGKSEAYYTDYRGKPQEFISAAKYGYLYQGQYYLWQKSCRGTPAFEIGPEAFVGFIENHDQVSNSNNGTRVRFVTSPGRFRALTALLLLGPWTPMLFQGQEFGSSKPFTYFAEVGDDALTETVRKGRLTFLQQFPSMRDAKMSARSAIPHESSTFESCKLDLSEREKHHHLYQMHIDLIRLRQTDPRFSQQVKGQLDGAVLSPSAFALRYFSPNDLYQRDRLLLVNFGPQTALEPLPEPLLAAPLGFEWETLWSSDSPDYGGLGISPVVTDEGWKLPAEAAVALQLIPEKSPRPKPKKQQA